MIYIDSTYIITHLIISVLYTYRFHIQSIIMDVDMYIVHNILVPMQASVYFWGIGM